MRKLISEEHINESKQDLVMEKLESISTEEKVKEILNLKNELAHLKTNSSEEKTTLKNETKRLSDLATKSKQGEEKAKDAQESPKSALEAQKLILLTVQGELTEKKSASTQVMSTKKDKQKEKNRS